MRGAVRVARETEPPVKSAKRAREWASEAACAPCEAAGAPCEAA